jgi:hypothetical protein
MTNKILHDPATDETVTISQDALNQEMGPCCDHSDTAWDGRRTKLRGWGVLVAIGGGVWKISSEDLRDTCRSNPRSIYATMFNRAMGVWVADGAVCPKCIAEPATQSLVKVDTHPSTYQHGHGRQLHRSDGSYSSGRLIAPTPTPGIPLFAGLMLSRVILFPSQPAEQMIRGTSQGFAVRVTHIKPIEIDPEGGEKVSSGGRRLRVAFDRKVLPNMGILRLLHTQPGRKNQNRK